MALKIVSSKKQPKTEPCLICGTPLRRLERCSNIELGKSGHTKPTTGTCKSCLVVYDLMRVVWTDMIRTSKINLEQATDDDARKRHRDAIALAKMRLAEPKPTECLLKKGRAS
jgi:ribosomal protein L34E